MGEGVQRKTVIAVFVMETLMEIMKWERKVEGPRFVYIPRWNSTKISSWKWLVLSLSDGQTKVTKNKSIRLFVSLFFFFDITTKLLINHEMFKCSLGKDNRFSVCCVGLRKERCTRKVRR